MQVNKGLTRKVFERKFSTDEQCFRHLACIKWSEGYRCKKCGNERYMKSKKPYGRRCTSCHYDESPTSGTLFHKVKFGLANAFGMVYDIVTSKKGANSIWLAERYGVKQTTAWLFRQKVQRAMASSGKHPLVDEVDVDEFEIGTPKKGQQGRAYSTEKIRVVIAVENRNGKAGRAYARVIKDYSSESLRPLFDLHIDKNASVRADGWSGYKPLKKDYPNLSQELSNQGRNFPMIHNQIRNFKNWLRGVHSYCNKEYLIHYINEYFFRFNRRNHRKSILNKIIERMTNHLPVTRTEIQTTAT